MVSPRTQYPSPGEYIYTHLTEHGEDFIASIYRGYKENVYPAQRCRPKRICSYGSFRGYIALYIKHHYLEPTRTEPAQIQGAVSFQGDQAVHDDTGRKLPFHPRRYYRLTTTLPLPRPKDIMHEPVVTTPSISPEAIALLSKIQEKWQRAKVRSSTRLRADIEKLAQFEIDVSDVETALDEYLNLERSDYDSADEYQDERADAWQSVLDAIGDLDSEIE